MSRSLNKVMLIGNMARDPEIREMHSGGKVANMRLITNETWKDRDGNRQQKTEGHDLVCYNERLVTVIEEYVKKGDLIYVEGMMKTQKWQDKDGNDRYQTIVEMPRFNSVLTMLGDSQNSDGGDQRRGGNDRGSQSRGDDRGGQSRGDDRDRNDDRQERGRGDDRGRNDDRSRDGGGGGGGRRDAFDDEFDDDVPF